MHHGLRTPLPLAYDLDLDVLPLDLHAKIQVQTSVRSAVRVVTDTHTDKRCQNYDTIKTITSQT